MYKYIMFLGFSSVIILELLYLNLILVSESEKSYNILKKTVAQNWSKGLYISILTFFIKLKNRNTYTFEYLNSI